MKKSLLLTTALVLGTLTLPTSALAGGLPEMTQEEVEASTSSSSAGIIVPLLLLIVIAAVASSSSSGGGIAESDIRLKEGVRQVGMTPQGLPLYRWRYAGLPGEWEGVMAQDVAITHKHAIRMRPFGYMAVDYAALGMAPRLVH